MSESKKPEDIDLPQLLREAVRSQLVDFHTCLPAQIESYDREKQKANVQPLLKRKYNDGSVRNLPIIVGVPVVFPRSKNRHIHFDLEKGDVVTLVFSERSIDKWKAKGGIVSPDDVRRGHLSDAYAIPGGYDFPNAFGPVGGQGSLELANSGHRLVLEQDGTILIKNENGQIEMNPAGQITAQGPTATLTVKDSGDVDVVNDGLTVNFKNNGKVVINNGTFELVSLLSDLLSEIIGAQVLTLLGLQPVVGVTKTFPVLKNQIDTFKE